MIVQQPNSKECFVCGRGNDKGLHMKWFSDRDKQEVFSEFVLSDEYCSYPGFAHGGIVSAVMDEIAARAVMINDHDPSNLFVTASMETNFLVTTPTNKPLKAVGRVVNREGRRAVVHGEIQTADGTVTAVATCHIVRPPDKFFERWNWDEVLKEWYV